MDERNILIKKKIMNERRKAGVLLILVGIGIPLILSLFQQEGEFRFFSSTMVAERSMTPREIKQMKEAIQEKKATLSGTNKIIENIKEKYRRQLGKDYYRERWVIHNYSGFSIPYKYSIALGLVLVLIGIGKLIMG